MPRIGFLRSLTLLTVALISGGLGLAGDTPCKHRLETCAEKIKSKYEYRGWLGIETDRGKDRALTIKNVLPGSPADRAGFQARDRLLSINGIPYDEANREQMKKLFKEGTKIGDKLSYVVQRGPEEVTLEATLVKIPPDVLEAMIQKHEQKAHAMAQK